MEGLECHDQDRGSGNPLGQSSDSGSLGVCVLAHAHQKKRAYRVAKLRQVGASEMRVRARARQHDRVALKVRFGCLPNRAGGKESDEVDVILIAESDRHQRQFRYPFFRRGHSPAHICGILPSETDVTPLPQGNSAIPRSACEYA